MRGLAVQHRLGAPLVKSLTSHSCTLEAAPAKQLEGWLRAHDYNFREVPHAVFAAQKGNLGVVFYASGKLVIQGKGTREFVEFVLEPEILREARLGYEEVLDPERLTPRLGIDESGKGDFFGPLCVAGVYVNPDVLEGWKEHDVRDSKRIGSDRGVAELARVIRSTPGCVYDVVVIGNAAYNRLYAKVGNLNRLLAWGHSRVIENLLERSGQMEPPPVRAVSDQFARTKSLVKASLMKLGRGLELVQRHRAESDAAVAAASILARDAFVRSLQGMSKEFGLTFPKGASAEVLEAGREFVRRWGRDRLSSVAKLHFKTADRLDD